MVSHDVSVPHSDPPKQHPNNLEKKTAPLTIPPSTDSSTFPFAADSVHDPEALTDKEKYGSSSDTDSGLGNVSDVQDASRHAEGLGKKKISTTQAVIIFITNEVGIGMLSLPSALNVLGLFPGLLCLIVLGLLSLYSAHNLIQYWRKYPYMLSIVDYGRALGGPYLEAVFAAGFLINMILISASATVTVAIGLNTMTDHATCTVVFTAVGCIAMWAMCVPHSMRFVSWASWPCTISIVATVLLVMIVLGVQGPRDPMAPLNFKAIGNSTFVEATAAFLNMAFAFAGNQTFPTVIAEMENPSRDFFRAATIEKCFTISLYILVSTVIYCLTGEQVVSPAIGSVQPTMAKVAYGVAFIGLLGTGLICGMAAARYLHVFSLRHIHLLQRGAKPSARRASTASDPSATQTSAPATPETSKKTEWAVWIVVVTAFWIVVFIITNAIPVFDSLLNISSALLLSWSTWGVAVLFWFDLNRNGRWRSSGAKMATAALNAAVLCITLFMTVPGMYASIMALLNVFADPTTTVNGPFTCADNR